MGQERCDRRTEASGHVLWRGQRLARQCDDAMRQRRAVNNGSLGGDCRAGIDADQPDIGRDTA